QGSRHAARILRLWTSDFFIIEMTLAGNRVRPFFCSAAPQAHSSVPAINLAAAARRGGQGWPHLRPPQGLALTGPSTVARCMERDWPGWKLPSAAIMVVGRGRPRGEA